MKRQMRGASVVATMTWNNRDYDIIRFGSRLRVVDRKTDRSLDCRGYMDLDGVRRQYPSAFVAAS